MARKLSQPALPLNFKPPFKLEISSYNSSDGKEKARIIESGLAVSPLLDLDIAECIVYAMNKTYKPKKKRKKARRLDCTSCYGSGYVTTPALFGWTRGEKCTYCEGKGFYWR